MEGERKGEGEDAWAIRMALHPFATPVLWEEEEEEEEEEEASSQVLFLTL